MGEPEVNQLPATPDRNTAEQGVEDKYFERQLKAMDQKELEAFWKDRVNQLINHGAEVLPYTSPTGDQLFENRVNTIIREHLQALAADPSLLEQSPYNHNTVDTTVNSPGRNVAQGADPVDLFNGNFAYQIVDFQLNGAGMDFIFARTYSQLSTYNGPLGQRWDHGYNLWLRVDEGNRTLHRSTGALSEETFRKHEQHEYWVPPDGGSGIILENGDSFVYLLPDGARIRYEPHQTLHPSIHVVSGIEDRYGNFLAFSYTGGRLVRVFINQSERKLDFFYDAEERISGIRDFTGRSWRYTYDDFGDLVAVTTPATARYKNGLTTRYEYSSALTSDPYLQHNLLAIIDADGRIYLENEYGSERGLINYRRVIRQRQGNGDVHFEYADLFDVFEYSYTARERPARQTMVTERDGRQTRYLFNRFGNMIFKQEYARLGGLPQLVSSHYRYNRDGNLTGMISPLGVITQVLYGRDYYERRFPQAEEFHPEQDQNLTREARLGFDNLLAIVKRGKYYAMDTLNMTGGLWSAGIFPDIFQTNTEDLVQKFTYEPEFQQLLTSSDPRFTHSADPAFFEESEYHRRLTRYVYAPGRGFQHFFLEAIELPVPILPDGTPGEPVVTRFTAYDAQGRIVRLIAPNGLETLNTYAQPEEGRQAGFLKTTALDPGGFNIRSGVELDELGRVVRLFRPQAFPANDGRFVSLNEYNELSQIIRSVSTAPFSLTTRNDYDRAGNIRRSMIELKDQDNVVTGTLVITNRYDDELNLIARKTGADETIKQTRILMDRASRPFLSIAPSGRKRKVLFNERSLLAKTIEDYGGVHAVTRGFYDADGRLIRLIGPRGSATRFTYDTQGRPVDVEDALGNRTVSHYDKIGNLLVECVFEKQADNTFVLLFRREFTYDELGRMIIAGANQFEPAPAVTDSELHNAFRESGPGELLTLKYFYDAAGNVVKKTDQDGRVFLSEFDILGRQVMMRDPDGNELRLRYDEEGNILRIDRQEVIRDPVTAEVIARQNFAENLTYDELGRLSARTTPAGTIRYRYDSRGNRVESEDELGNKVVSTFDLFSRMTARLAFLHRYEAGETPVPVRLSLEYNLDDQVVAQTDALGRTTRFRYDSAGRLIGTILPDGSQDAAVYDRSGNLVTYRDRNGLSKTLVWDELDRNTSLILDTTGLSSDVELQSAGNYSAVYDALGRFKSVQNDFIINTFTYNSLNCLLEEKIEVTALTGILNAQQYVIRKQFSNSGALTDITYPSGRIIRYRRDVLDRVVGVEQIQKGNSYPGSPTAPDSYPIATQVYEGLRIKRVTRHNGVTTEHRYDFIGRTIEIAHTTGANNILTLQLMYDALGNLRRKIELAADFQRTQGFSYDSLSRLYLTRTAAAAALVDLVSFAPAGLPLPDDLPDLQSQFEPLLSAPVGGESDRFAYDLCGNRVTRATNGSAESYEPNLLDQYTKVRNNLRRHDRNGNLLEDDTFLYFYDHRNQLSGTKKKSDGKETRLYFDYFGRRCLQQEDTQATIFLYDNHNLIEEYNGHQIRRSIVSNTEQDGILLASGGGREYYVLPEQNGTVRYLFDAAVKRNFYIYDAFGALQEALVPVDDNPFRFAGKRLLGETGKYDFIYRTYDPSTGRFLQRDPKGFVDGTNLYSFARNNPLTFTDSFGLESRAEQAPVVAKLGAELAYRHPAGFTLKLPDNFDDPKLKAARERINNPLDRGVGIRSVPPGSRSATADLRRADRPAKEAFNRSLPPPQRARKLVRAIDHIVELQTIIRRIPGRFAPGADTVRPQDYRPQDWSLNSSQGRRLQILIEQQIHEGAPLDTPAGGVARERDFNKFWNREGYRTGMRYAGNFFLAGGTLASLFSFGDDIREGNVGSALLNGTGAAGGMLEIGGMAAKSSSLLKAGRFLGAPAAVVGSGVIGVQIGTNLYENYVDKELYLDAGSWVERKTGSRVLGATAAAATAVGDAIVHAPEAAYDYARKTWTLDPDEIDWGKTLSPWRWF